jgi:replicative DNA helicase
LTNIFQLPADVLRPAPSNIEAEQALLGTLLMRNSAFDKVSDFLRPEHFSDPTHGRLYELVSQTISAGKKADVVTLKANAESDPMLSQAGGYKFLVSVAACAPTMNNAEEYGRILHDLFLRREIISLSAQASATAYDTTDPAERQIESIEEHLFTLTEARAGSNLVSLGEAASRAITQIDAARKANGALIGVPTGLADLDHKLGGLHKSDLIIVAGRPSMGKSGLALTMAFNAARANKSVALFSLEMSCDQLANRALAHFAHMDSHRMRNGRIGDADIGNLMRRQQEFAQLPFEIEDGAGQSVAQIRKACRRLKRKKLDLIVIDYLQLIAPSGKSGNRVQEISEITWGLKCLAKDMAVPVVALSQLSRAVESREDKRPMLSDLRESGSIEQDADVVMFVYRDQYYLERANRAVPFEVENTAEVIVAKQRHGPIGSVTCHFDHSSAWFSNLAR